MIREVKRTQNPWKINERSLGPDYY
jgi:hypothetical protein